jgi:hypothetical protein
LTSTIAGGFINRMGIKPPDEIYYTNNAGEPLAIPA